ncbi:DUF4136 domain-containing protein [Vibrio sp. ZSDE26]|uniref:DUF4136 domain-containing protein n=1 Tax=Vibrio amylolyticus TaxID=2847292 RepID=A0A9X1XJ24_9VIBR|nr:DUF4136 domain-containing protein [Vibrio amylolyticus]MCK6264147.1 DUF4136 domain-containing protein [Vibrio amylolyticus]
MIKKFALVSVLLLAGCSTSVEPQRPMDFGVVVSGDSQQFESVSTFAWHERSGTVLVKDKELGQKSSQLYHSLVEQQMLERGYRLVSQPLQADVLLVVALAQQSEITDSDIFAKTLLSTGIITVDSDGDAVEKGSLYLAAFPSNLIEQADVEQPIWKALAQRPMKEGVDEATRQALASDLVKRMMSSIPVSNN